MLFKSISPKIIRRLVASDAGIALQLEEILKDNSMIFMLPFVDFPAPSPIIKLKTGEFELYRYGADGSFPVFD